MANRLCHNSQNYKNPGGRDSSVGIASRNVLEGPGIETWWGARFSAPVQTGPRAYPASCTTGAGSFPEGKAAGAWCWPQHHLQCRDLKLALRALLACYRENLYLYLTKILPSVFCTVCMYVCISLHNINWLVFTAEMKCVYCAVRIYNLNKIYFNSIFKIVIWISMYTL